MRILFLPKHELKGASSRYRTLQYLPYLDEKKCIYTIEPLFSDKYLEYKYNYGKENKLITLRCILKRIIIILTQALNYDILVIEKELLPYFPPFLEYYLKLTKIPYVVDYDDAVWHNYDQHRIPIIRKLLGKKIETIIRNSTATIVGSEYLRNYSLNVLAKNVFKIPTVIDLNKYHDIKSTKNDEFIVGWIGSPSSSRYILELDEVLKIFTNEFNAVVNLIGFDRSLKKDLNFKFNIIDWNEETEVEEMYKFDIGIMPLTNTPFEKGKCGFKLIQYMGCRKPVIASPIGENNIIVDDNINGFLADNERYWLKYLTFFYKNKDQVHKFGENGFDKVKKYYSLENNQEKYLEIIKNSMSK